MEIYTAGLGAWYGFPGAVFHDRRRRGLTPETSGAWLIKFTAA